MMDPTRGSMEAFIQHVQVVSNSSAPTEDFKAAEKVAPSSAAEGAAGSGQSERNCTATTDYSIACEQHVIGTEIVPPAILLPLRHGPASGTQHRAEYVSQVDDDYPSSAELVDACNDNIRAGGNTKQAHTDTCSSAAQATEAASQHATNTEYRTPNSAAYTAAGPQEPPESSAAALAALEESNSVLSLSRSSSTGSRVRGQTASQPDAVAPIQQPACQQQDSQHSAPPTLATPAEAVTNSATQDCQSAAKLDTEPSFGGVNALTEKQPVQDLPKLKEHLQPQQGIISAAAGAVCDLETAQQASSQSPGGDSRHTDALVKLKPIRTAVQDVQQRAAQQRAGSAANAGHRQFKGSRKTEALVGNSEVTKAAKDSTGLTSGFQSAEPPAAPSAALTSAAGDDAIMTPMYHKTSSTSLLSLTIQHSTPLKPDILVTSPVVRLHVVDAATGEYVQMMHVTDQLQGQPCEQMQHQCGGPAGGCGAADGVSGGVGGPLKSANRHIVDSCLQDKMLESLGRPALTTIGNNTPCPRPALLEHIPPIQTQPFDMLAGTNKPGHGRIDGSLTGLVAEWNEELCIDFDLEQLQDRDAVLLLEVLQLPSGFARFQHHVQDFDLAGRCHAVAWSFLRLQGLSGQHQQLAQGKPLQLQLYQYKPAALGHAKSLFKGFKAPNPAAASKAVYLSWMLSGFAGDRARAAGSPRQRLQATLSGLWKSRDGAASPSPAGILQQMQSASPGGLLSPRTGKQVVEADKYPGFLQVVLSARPRPVPESMVVVTDPATGLRPNVPAGYGSGFEAGRIPFCLLHKPRALGTTASGRSIKRSQTGTVDAAAAMLQQQVMMLESRLHRPHTAACQVPNAVLVDVKGSAGGCSCVALSRDGRWLAAACADAAGRFKINLYQALTGRLCWMLGTHDGMVYSINWARDDSAVVTTSADYTAKVFHLPILPGSTSHTANPYSGLIDWSLVISSAAGSLGLMNKTGGTGAATAAAAEAAAEAGVLCTVLQHKCYVYACELHPVRQPWLLAVTGAYDGCVRVWETEQGQELYCLQVSQCPINCLTLNQLGSRMFAGDAAGILHELSVDVAPLSSAAAAAFATSMMSTPGRSLVAADDVSSGGCTDAASAVVSASGQSLNSPRTFPYPATPRGATATATAEAVSPVAATIRYGSTAAMMAAGSEVLKVLRSSVELFGSPIITISCHPGGHQLLVLTKSAASGTASAAAAAARRSRGLSDLVLIDTKLLMVAKRLGGVKCCSAPLKFGVSPDGEYVICGSEDGSATIWHLETATATSLPHMTLGGSPVYCMTWSNCFHTVVICSFSPYAPIRVLCFAPDQPAVCLNTPSKDAAAAKRNKTQRKAVDAFDADAGSMKRYVLPDHLTPHHVHALLADVRAAAVQRGIICAPDDPNGNHLVIKAAGSHHSAAPHRHHQSNRPLPNLANQKQQASDDSTNSGSSTNSSSMQTAGIEQTARIQQTPEDFGGRIAANASVASPLSAEASSAQGQVPAAAGGVATTAGLHSLGGRNRHNRRVRVSASGRTPWTDDGVGGLQGGEDREADQPSTPKVVVNRNKAARGGIAAPWLVSQ